MRVRPYAQSFRASSPAWRWSTSGPVVATNADEETLPLIIQRVHPVLGQVADAWLSDGQDAYHVRMYAPDEAWLDGAIRELIYYRLTLQSGSP